MAVSVPPSYGLCGYPNRTGDVTGARGSGEELEEGIMAEDARICPDNHIGNAARCWCGKGTKPYTGVGYGRVPCLDCECLETFDNFALAIGHWEQVHRRDNSHV